MSPEMEAALCDCIVNAMILTFIGILLFGLLFTLWEKTRWLRRNMGIVIADWVCERQLIRKHRAALKRKARLQATIRRCRRELKILNSYVCTIELEQNGWR